MGKSNNLEDYTFEIQYSDNEELNKEKLRCLAKYLINLGIKEGTIPIPPGYNNTNDVTLEPQIAQHNNINREYVETPRCSDLIHSTASTIFSKVPICGELFNLIFTAPATKRRDEWIESLEHRIISLEDKYPNIIEAIKKSELAISATFYACSMALKTTNTEKLEAIQNIILNTALKPNYEEYKIQMFLSIIDSFTEWHIRLLHYLSDPKEAILKHNPNFSLGTLRRIRTMTPFWEIYPESKSISDHLAIIMDDLHSKGLVYPDGKYILKSYDSYDTFFKVGYPYNKCTTDFGNELLEFIKNPE